MPNLFKYRNATFSSSLLLSVSVIRERVRRIKIEARKIFLEYFFFVFNFARKVKYYEFIYFSCKYISKNRKGFLTSGTINRRHR